MGGVCPPAFVLSTGFVCPGSAQPAAAKQEPGLLLNTDGLNAVVSEQQATVGGVDAVFLGLGSDVRRQLELRSQIFGKPGPPWGGFGFFTPPADAGFPEELTAARIREVKLTELAAMADGKPSFYSFRLQPAYDITGCVCMEAEVLIRGNNGQDSAPFEDVLTLCDPKAPADVEQVYAKFMAYQGVQLVLETFKLDVLRHMDCISVNYRKHDLRPDGEVYKLVEAALGQLSEQDHARVLSKTCLEVTEDQAVSDTLVDYLAAWRKLGYQRFALDDLVGDVAASVRSGGAPAKNFHTLSATKPLFCHFKVLKVDMDWASLIFLTHPAWWAQDEEAILAGAKEDKMKLPRMPATDITYSAVLDEFVDFALTAIAGKAHTITIELTLSATHENNAHAVAKIKERGLDMFGEHRHFFLMQGGVTGAKAFTPETLANHCINEAN